MPTKAEQYAQMADQVARQLTGSWQEWAGFLTTAARLYKYPFHEQLMIYAQHPALRTQARLAVLELRHAQHAAFQLLRVRIGLALHRLALSTHPRLALFAQLLRAALCLVQLLRRGLPRVRFDFIEDALYVHLAHRITV